MPDLDDDVHECPLCGGWGLPLGRLGSRFHLRCRQCGSDFNVPLETPGEAGATDHENSPDV